MSDTDIQSRILADARNLDPSSRSASRLSAHREALLLYRAKGLSYEDIAATLSQLGLRIGKTQVGTYCRGAFRKADVQRKRAELEAGPRTAVPANSAVVPSFIGQRRTSRA